MFRFHGYDKSISAGRTDLWQYSYPWLTGFRRPDPAGVHSPAPEQCTDLTAGNHSFLTDPGKMPGKMFPVHRTADHPRQLSALPQSVHFPAGSAAYPAADPSGYPSVPAYYPEPVPCLFRPHFLPVSVPVQASYLSLCCLVYTESDSFLNNYFLQNCIHCLYYCLHFLPPAQ